MRHPFKSRLTHGPAPLNAIVLAGSPDRDARLILLSALTHAGYRVRLANTGGDLLREAMGDGVDLIVSEIRMQSAKGSCAIQALKLDPELQHIPVIAYSESGAVGDEAWAHSVGADAFLRNPANVAALFDTVASMLGASGLQEPHSRELVPGANDLALA
jgi:CheY-like chemotaxis protein